MEEVKRHIAAAVSELRKHECKCDKHTTCERCIAIIKLNNVHNFLSQNKKHPEEIEISEDKVNEFYKNLKITKNRYRAAESNMNWEDILKSQYQQNHIDDIKDDELFDESIAICEGIFELMDKEELLHHSRSLALSYLALKYEKSKSTK